LTGAVIGDRFGQGGEVLFDRICRDNGIIHRLTAPRHPTTTGKVERWHQTVQTEFLGDAGPFCTLEEARAAVDEWRGGVQPPAAASVPGHGMSC